MKLRLSPEDIKPYTPIAVFSRDNENWFFGCFTDEDEDGTLKWEGDDAVLLHNASPQEMSEHYDLYRMVMPEEMTKIVTDMKNIISDLGSIAKWNESWTYMDKYESQIKTLNSYLEK